MSENRNFKDTDFTDVNNEYIRQGVMGYSVLDGYWSDAGTFGSLLRAGEMVERENKELLRGNADKRRSYYNYIINIF